MTAAAACLLLLVVGCAVPGYFPAPPGMPPAPWAPGGGGGFYPPRGPPGQLHPGFMPRPGQPAPLPGQTQPPS
jgi:hypothetical protein